MADVRRTAIAPSASVFPVLLTALVAPLTGCVKPAAMPSPEPYELDAPAKAVFDGAISLFVEWRMLLGASDRETGLVSTEEYVLGWGDDFLGKSAGHWADCGEEFFISRAASADEFRIRIQVRVQAVDSARTLVHVLTSMTVYEEDVLGSPRTRCSSRGRLERRLIRDLEKHLRATS